MRLTHLLSLSLHSADHLYFCQPPESDKIQLIQLNIYCDFRVCCMRSALRRWCVLAKLVQKAAPTA